MAYFIFLNYLRSLEEFRKNPHIKIPPKSPCANFQSLGEFKNQNFNSKKSFFFTFGPTTLTGPLSLWPSRPRWPLSSRRPKPSPLGLSAARPTCVVAYFTKDVFFFDSRLPFSAPSLYSLADAWAPLVSSIFYTAPTDPGRVTTAPLAPHLGMPPNHYCPPITPPLIPLQTEL
jgi:hypothetical protein